MLSTFSSIWTLVPWALSEKLLPLLTAQSIAFLKVNARKALPCLKESWRQPQKLLTFCRAASHMYLCENVTIWCESSTKVAIFASSFCARCLKAAVLLKPWRYLLCKTILSFEAETLVWATRPRALLSLTSLIIFMELFAGTNWAFIAAKLFWGSVLPKTFVSICVPITWTNASAMPRWLLQFSISMYTLEKAAPKTVIGFLLQAERDTVKLSCRSSAFIFVFYKLNTQRLRKSGDTIVFYG